MDALACPGCLPLATPTSILLTKGKIKKACVFPCGTPADFSTVKGLLATDTRLHIGISFGYQIFESQNRSLSGRVPLDRQGASSGIPRGLPVVPMQGPLSEILTTAGILRVLGPHPRASDVFLESPGITTDGGISSASWTSSLCPGQRFARRQQDFLLGILTWTSSARNSRKESRRILY